MRDAAAFGDQQEQPEVGEVEAHFPLLKIVSMPDQPSFRPKAGSTNSTLWATDKSVKSIAMEISDA
ncbi:hypothetical protein X739_30810 [Mesorhizobium sp. LNHC220B00]|nr:hypothetical protein X739_30810 [Mesorhizobium sp. LNHC220B00]